MLIVTTERLQDISYWFNSKVPKMETDEFANIIVPDEAALNSFTIFLILQTQILSSTSLMLFGLIIQMLESALYQNMYSVNLFVLSYLAFKYVNTVFKIFIVQIVIL